MTIVLDTNVVSELLRVPPDPNVFDWAIRQEAETLFLSAVSEAELLYGVEIMPVGRRRERLLAVIENILRAKFAGRILPFDSEAARAYAEIAAARRMAGLPISQSDCQIAAIARSRGAAVATRDASGFEGCGVTVINPWLSG